MPQVTGSETQNSTGGGVGGWDRSSLDWVWYWRNQVSDPDTWLDHFCGIYSSVTQTFGLGSHWIDKYTTQKPAPLSLPLFTFVFVSLFFNYIYVALSAPFLDKKTKSSEHFARSVLKVHVTVLSKTSLNDVNQMGYFLKFCFLFKSNFFLFFFLKKKKIMYH